MKTVNAKLTEMDQLEHESPLMVDGFDDLSLVMIMK